MGTLKAKYRLRKDTYIVYGSLSFILLLFIFLCQYIKDFFNMYEMVQQILFILQIVVVVIISALIITVIKQYQKVGEYSFYTKGIEDNKTGETFYYNDIISYYFNAQNNKEAESLILKLEEGIKEIPALLPREAFILFQEDHARVWLPFMIKKIDEYDTTYNFELYEDITSFKISLQDVKRTHEIVVSKEGITLYDTFYQWTELLRYEVSYTGMVSIVDQSNKKIFLEPLTCIEKSYVLMRLLNNYIKESV